MIKRFRKKPITIEAVQFTGMNALQVHAFTDGRTCPTDESLGHDDWNSKQLIIQTLEGDMIASVGDWIIKGVKGEVYPIKPDILEKTYDPVE